MTHLAALLAMGGTLCVAAFPLTLEAQERPPYLRDRGTGVATSMFGTYVRKGELLLYPFFEWYSDHNLEYKPEEFGHVGGEDYRGRYRASEGLIFLGYGVTDNLALELEVAMISAELRKAPNDPSTMPSKVRESGLGDVEGQIRYRFQRETTTRPELFSYFETVFPLQKNKDLIGTSAWEYKLGFGVTRGKPSGTYTFRVGVDWDGEDKKFDVGEYALEYLRRFSSEWRYFSMIEGNQLDEVDFVNEIQWHFHRRAYLKVGTGIGLTPNATDLSPEIGIMFRF